MHVIVHHLEDFADRFDSAVVVMLSSRPIHLDPDGHVHKPARTPGAALRARSALQENALHHGAMTGNVKPKTGDSFQPHTLRNIISCVSLEGKADIFYRASTSI